MLKIQCEYKNKFYCSHDARNLKYTCSVFTQYIPEDKVIEKFDGKHEMINSTQSRTNNDVHIVEFKDSVIPRIPFGLPFHFNNICTLMMNNCQLKEIEKCDLRGMHQLTKLNLSQNLLEFLPGDLFKFTPQLQKIYFADNKIKWIDPEILDGFKSMIEVDFSNNVNVNVKFNSSQPQTFGTFEKFKSNLTATCMSMKYTEFKEMTMKNKKLTEENSSLKALANKLELGISEDINAMMSNEKLKDFILKVNGKEFKVHKFIFMARSSYLAEMIINNPEIEVLNLDDISEESFNEILSFVYTDKEPSAKADIKEIFSISTKLKIKKLREICAKRLMATLNAKNAYDILLLGHKLDHIELKIKSFEEIKKIFPEIKNELANEPEKLKKLIEIRMQLEEELKKI